MTEDEKSLKIYLTITSRMFRKRGEVKDDWYWRRDHREQIRHYIREIRKLEKCIEDEKSLEVT